MNFADIPNPSLTPAPEAKATETEVKPAVTGEVAAVKPEGSEAPKTEAKAEPKVFKLNIKGKEVTVTEEQAVALLQKAAYADQQIKEAAQTKKSAEGLLQRLKENPWEVLADPAVGHDIKKLAVEKIKEFMADEAKDPKERELEMTRKELETYKKQEEAAKKAKEESEKATLVQQQAEGFRKEIIDAMESVKDMMPKSQAAMDRVIAYMRAGYRKTGTVLPAAEAIKYVVKDYQAEVGEMFKTANVDKLIEMFGEDVISKLRKADLAKLKTANADTLKGDKTKVPSGLPLNKKGRISEKEFWKQNLNNL